MLRILLTHEVITIRNPGGPTKQSVALRDMSKGKIVGPQIFAAGQLLITQQTLSQYDINSVVQANSEGLLSTFKFICGLTY